MLSLEIFEPDGNSRTIPLSGGVWTIGRSRENSVCLPHPGVTRLHALMVIDPTTEVTLYQDCDSKNGSILHNQKVKRVMLKNLDRIQVGPYILVFKQFSEP